MRVPGCDVVGHGQVGGDPEAESASTNDAATFHVGSVTILEDFCGRGFSRSAMDPMPYELRPWPWTHR